MSSRSETFAQARPKYRDLYASNYRGANLFSSYDRDEGLLVIPVMGPIGTRPVVVRVHASVGYRSVQFEYAKQLQPPLFPAPADTDSGDTILSSSLVFPVPRINESGDLTFGVSGEYVFVQPGGGRGTEDKFPIDKHPFVSPIDVIDKYPGPYGDPEVDVTWQWNLRSVDARLLGSYGILG